MPVVPAPGVLVVPAPGVLVVPAPGTPVPPVLELPPVVLELPLAPGFTGSPEKPQATVMAPAPAQLRRTVRYL